MEQDQQLWKPYPEEIKMTAQGLVEVEVSLPQHWHVVMGASGRTHQEVEADQLISRGIPLYKRKGGGGTVLLGPGTIVVTVHAGVGHLFRSQAYFKAINEGIMEVFATWKPLNYHQKGHSDIAVENRKIVGSSIFRRKHHLLFQASILLEYDIALMGTVLKHPPREPDYRQGRGHAAFLTSLRELGIETDEKRMVADLATQLPQRLKTKIDAADQDPA